MRKVPIWGPKALAGLVMLAALLFMVMAIRNKPVSYSPATRTAEPITGPKEAAEREDRAAEQLYYERQAMKEYQLEQEAAKDRDLADHPWRKR